ncbi:MAG: right-handed parallel beta-helix repeat-containing protein, partial [Patescibacteria group bacterium]|nr:right-handed parallel beta-helix repeat-containing protein [Patescibacteria group bacterium]
AVSSGGQVIAIGTYLKTSTGSGNSNYIGVIGAGLNSSSPLVNTADSSLMIGYGSTVPAWHLYGGGTATRIAIGTTTTSTQLSTLELQGSGGADPFDIASTSGSSIFRVAKTGNVGIGTSTPVAALSFASSTTAAGGINFGDSTANLYRSGAGTIRTDGSVYVGSNITVAGPQITFTGATNTSIYNNSSNSGANLKIVGANNANSYLTLQSTSGAGTSDYINFLLGNNGGTEAMRIIDSGNVGIGTTTPGKTLTVAGNAQITGLGNGLVMASSSGQLSGNAGSIRIASSFAGADCSAKINAASADLGSSAGEIWVDQSCGTSWTSTTTIPSNQVLRFTQGGTYTLSKPIIGGNIVGSGDNSAWNVGNNVTIIKEANSVNLSYLVEINTNNGYLQNVEVDGNQSNNASGQDGIYIAAARAVALTNVYVHDAKRYGIYAKSSTSSANDAAIPRLTSTIVYNNGSDGMRVQDATDAFVSQSEFEHNGGSGIYLLNGGAARIDHSDIAQNTGSGIYATSTVGGVTSSYLIITANQFGSGYAEDIYIDGYNGSAYGSISNNITGNVFYGGNNRASSTYAAIRLRNSYNNTVSSNTFDSPTANAYKYGINIDNGGFSNYDTLSSNMFNGTYSSAAINPVNNVTQLTGNSTGGNYLLGNTAVSGNFTFGGYLGQAGVPLFNANSGASTAGITGTLFGVANAGNAWVQQIDTSGNLGVAGRVSSALGLATNTTTPAATLAVTSIANAVPLIVASSSDSVLLTVLGNGNVGIGTNNPGYALVIKSQNGNGTLQIQNQSDGNPSILLSSAGGNQGYASFYNNNNETIRLNSNGNSYFVSGNVGIGTSTPGQTLTVAGTIQITGGSPAQGKVLLSDANGVGSWVATSTLGITGGSASPGGLSGQVQYNSNGSFAGSAALLTNGTLAGVNATSSSYSFNIQGSSGVNPFNISSSTGTSLVTVTQNGNLGVGTSTPPAVMTVQGTSGNLMQAFNGATSEMSLSSSGVLAVANSFQVSGTTYANGYINWTNGPGNLFQNSGTVYNNSPNYLWLTGGNVHYDSLSSGTYGIWQFANTFGANTNSTSTGNFRLIGINVAPNFGTGASYQYNALNPMTALAVQPVINVNTNSTGTYAALLVNPTETSVGVGTTNYIARFQTDGNDKMVVTSAGNVGIGSTTPGAQLAIQGTSTAPTAPPLTITSSTGATLFTISPTGNIGIGVANPAQPLDIQANSSQTSQILFKNSDYNGVNTGSAFFFSTGAATGNTYSAFQALNSGGSAVGYLALNQFGGNVGIGTTTPGQTLTVVGTVQITGGGPGQGKLLQSDANGVATWVATSSLGIVSGGTPGGSSGQVQYNNNGSFAGSAALLTNSSLAGVNATSSSYTFNVQGSSGVNPFNVSSSSGTSLLTVLANGNVGIGTSSPIAKLSIENAITSSGGNAVGTILASSTLNLATNSGYEFGSRFLNWVGSTATGTYDGMLIRMTDNNSATNTVRGLEVQAYSGSNTKGVNAGIVSFGHTFGVQGITDGLAGGVAQPAGIYAELDHPTNGNALRVYSNTSTSATLVSVYQESSAYTGDAFVMDLGNSGGSFASGNFINLKVAGSSKFTVNQAGKVTAAGGFNGQCLTSGSFNTNGGTSCNMDVAEIYNASEPVAAGDVLILDTVASTTAPTSTPLVKRAATSYDQHLLGVVSTAPGLILGIHNGQTMLGGESTTYINTPEASTSPAVALTGRVPVKVTNENGNVEPGDFLTSSAQFPGYAMKATRSGYVVGQALEGFTSTTTNASGEVMIFIHPGFENINNTFVLGASDGQLASATFSVIASASSTDVAMLINQQGTGNLLQLQQNGQDRLLIANDGSLSLLASTTIATSTVLTVNNGTTTVFTINARGDAAVAGVITIKNDTFAGSVATDQSGQAQITFSYPLGTGKPVVQLTPEADFPVFAQVISWATDTNQNYLGFTIQTFGLNGSTTSAIVHYLVVGKEDGYTTNGQPQLQVSSQSSTMTHVMDSSGNWVLVPMSSLSVNGSPVATSSAPSTSTSTTTTNTAVTATSTTNSGTVAGTSTPATSTNTSTTTTVSQAGPTLGVATTTSLALP